ncbi:MAG: aldo/keto reductase [Desulfobacteraceae bacterium]|nr:MAG: aldo/keto reductase [Desulfobacteraceae bacterium]
MKLGSLGTSEFSITPIIMGTWQAGKRMWAGIDDAEITKAIRAAFDAGITTFDTAEEYGWGHSEHILGKALAHVRHQVVYATKVFPNHLKYDQVIGRCHRSLKNLKTDYIDLYQVHWPAGSWGTKVVPIEETMRAMNELRHQGKIRAIGVSNFSLNQLEEAAQFAHINSLQPPYSLFWRHVEMDAMPYCIENNITILAYSSMAQGILTGKFGPHHKFEKGDHRVKNKLFKPENFKRVQQALTKLRPIADRYNISLGQLALAWVIAQPGTCAIAGARKAEQVLQNAKAAEVRLSAADLEEMDTISRIVTDHLDGSPVMWEF